MKLSRRPLFTEAVIQRRVAELAKAISDDFAGRELLLITVLKGSAVFASDLMRGLDLDVIVEYVRARSYRGTLSQGSVQLSLGPERPVRGKHVLVVEDILDTGRTSAVIMDRLLSERPETLSICAFLDKPSRRTFDIRADYVGFTIEDHFVVGYGLDYEERFRNLPDVYVLEDEA